MKLYTYLNYAGNCRQAFEFYVQHLGGTITSLTTHGEMGDPSVAPEWKDAVLERIYNLLNDGGQIFMPMEETFFAHRFAMLRDRFGTSWMLLQERSKP